jgi:outer membrane protein assembly factor BamB
VLKLLLCVPLLAWAVVQPTLQDWNQWRGPNRDGIAVGFTVPSTWPERPKQVWKVTAGVGHSSPVVSGNRVFLFSRVGEQEAMTAYDMANGKQIWRQAYDAPYTMNPAAMSHGKGPKSTPVADRGRVFALGITGVLSAYDAASGKVIWRHEFSKEFKNTAPEFGTSMSPLIDGDRVIAHVGGAGAGAIIAFDVANGAREWTWKGDGPAYASPIIATFGSARHLITQTQSHLVGLSPADGRELWRLPFTTDYDQNIVTPVIADGLLIHAGLAKPSVAVRVVQEGSAWKLQEVWRNPDIPMYMSSPVAARGVLYGLTHRNRGQFFAVELKSGRVLWTSPPRQGENAALTAAADLLIATTTEGEISVMKQGREAFQPVRKYTVADSPIWAHPAFSARGVLVKDAETLALWAWGEP